MSEGHGNRRVDGDGFPPARGAAPVPSVLGTSSGILALSLLTLGLGVAVQVALAAVLGVTVRMDAYLVGITLPALVPAVALPVSASVLVPLLKRLAAEGRAADGRWAVRRLAVLSASVGVAAAVVLAAGALPAVRILAPGLDPAAAELAARVLRITAVALPFDFVRSVSTGALYAGERFFRAQLAPSLNHALILAGALLLVAPFGLDGLAAAWVVGSVAMFVLVVPGTGTGRRHGDAVTLRHGELLGRLPAVLLVTLALQGLPVVDRLVASTLGNGSVAVIGYGGKLLEILLRTFPMAIALAAFPRLSAVAAGGDEASFAAMTRSSLRSLLVTTLPLAVVVLLLAHPVVAVFLQRGAFDATATDRLATVLSWYAVALVPAAVASFLSSAMFAAGAARSLAAVSAGLPLVAMVLDVLLAGLLGEQGIAAAAVAVHVVYGAALVVVLTVRLRRRLVAGVSRFPLELGAAVAVLAAVVGVLRRVVVAPAQGTVAMALAVALTVAAGAAAFLAVLAASGNREIGELRAAAGRAGRRLLG